MSKRPALPGLRQLSDLIIGKTPAAELATAPAERAAAFIELSRNHGVEPWLAALAPGTPQWAVLREQHAGFAASVARDRRELREFGRLAAAAGARWVILKGVAVAEDLYPRPDLRFGVDIDVLVDPAAFESTISTLTDAGWTLLDRNWPLIERVQSAELSLRSPTGGLFDVHWHLINDVDGRRQIDLPTSRLLDRARTLGSGRPALSREDQLIHIAVHAARSGANRLHWLLDAHLAATATTDWASVAERAARAGVGPRVGLVLLRAHHWLGTPLPGGVLEAMGMGRTWQRVSRLVDRVSPLSRDPATGSLSRSFARSTEGTGVASLAELVRHGAKFVRQGGRSAGANVVVHDPSDRRSTFYRDPDDAARARYFAAVGRESPNRSASRAASSGAE